MIRKTISYLVIASMLLIDIARAMEEKPEIKTPPILRSHSRLTSSSQTPSTDNSTLMSSKNTSYKKIELDDDNRVPQTTQNTTGDILTLSSSSEDNGQDETETEEEIRQLLLNGDEKLYKSYSDRFNSPSTTTTTTSDSSENSRGDEESQSSSPRSTE